MKTFVGIQVGVVCIIIWSALITNSVCGYMPGIKKFSSLARWSQGILALVVFEAVIYALVNNLI